MKKLQIKTVRCTALHEGSDFMNGCETNLSISALACAIAKNKTAEEINALGTFFTQLGDSLETISAFNELNKNAINNENNKNLC